MTDKTKDRDFIANLKLARRNARAAARSGLRSNAKAIMKNSSKRVPVQTGELKESAYVGAPGLNNEGVIVIEFGYGAGHAVEVHEDTLTIRDDGQAKFLELAMLEVAPNVMRVLSDRLGKALAKVNAPPPEEDSGEFSERPRT